MTVTQPVILSFSAFLSMIFSAPFPPFALKSRDEFEADRDTPDEVAGESLNAAEEMESALHGRVISVSPGSETIAILPSDTVENEEPEEVGGTSPSSFRITSKTSFAGVDSLTGIAPGDLLTVDCYDFNGLIHAAQMTLEKTGNNQLCFLKEKQP
jgi:hypothetical protein